jgi:hypothetical protein
MNQPAPCTTTQQGLELPSLTEQFTGVWKYIGNTAIDVWNLSTQLPVSAVGLALQLGYDPTISRFTYSRGELTMAAGAELITLGVGGAISGAKNLGLTAARGVMAANTAHRVEVTSDLLKYDVADNVVFNSGGDRLIGAMGPARTANPIEFDGIVSNLRANGVDIRYSTNEFAYGPTSAGGRPGNIVFDSDASISAIRHEYGHFLDDKALGFPGQRFYYENPQFRVATERSQYLGEIRTARQVGDTGARRMLIQDYLNERQYLIDNYYFTPDGTKILYGGPYGR